MTESDAESIKIMETLREKLAQYPEPTITFAEIFAQKEEIENARIRKLMKIPPTVSEKIKKAQKSTCLPDFPFAAIESKFFNDYIALGKKLTYSLPEFHFASILPLASMVLGRKVVTKVGTTSIYSNVFVMVSGQTSISGKSVACNMAINHEGKYVFRENPGAKCYSTEMIQGTISEARLMQDLNDVYNLLWYYDDCAAFFSQINKWNDEILSRMCGIYDGTAQERKLSNSKPKKVKKDGDVPEDRKWSCPTPFMSILFNTTTDNIESVVNKELAGDGLLPRLMCFYGMGGQSRPNVDMIEEDEKAFMGIGLALKKVQSLMLLLPKNESIIFSVNPDIETWKINNDNKYPKTSEWDAHRTAGARGFIHAYKLAMIFTMFDTEFSLPDPKNSPEKYPLKLQIPEKHAKSAIAIVEKYLMPRMVYLLNLSKVNDATNKQVIVLRALTQYFHGSCTRSELLRQTHLESKEMDKVLTTLVESDEIELLQHTELGAKKKTVTIIKK